MNLLERLHIGPDQLEDLNSLLLDPTVEAMSEFLDVVARYGTPEEINRKAQEASKFENLMSRLKAIDSPYVEDIEWLIDQRDRGAFVTVEDYRRKVLGDQVEGMTFKDDSAVTLEISAAQYFPYLRVEAEKAIDEAELMPSRFIRVRNMAEAENDLGDLLAFSAAMQVMGASFVETPDTRGTDGSNVHLGEPLETITGYYGGVGQPNDRALKWVDEVL
jgi:hypothetical protein